MALASVFTFTVYAFFIRAGEANLLGAAIGAFGFGDAAAYIRGNGLSEVLTTGVFILIIAALVQFIEMVIKKMSRPLYDALGIYLPLITTNCTVLGVSLLNINKIQPGGEWATLSFAPGLLWAGLSGLFAGVGFTLVMLLMSGIRERLEVTSLPRSFKGVPIAFVCTGMMALAFFGFAGMIGGLLDNFGR
jgi:electron transport complex protein RnfA